MQFVHPERSYELGMPLAAGEYTVEVSHDGYPSKEVAVRNGGEPTDLPVFLISMPDTLEFAALPLGALVMGSEAFPDERPLTTAGSLADSRSGSTK